MGVCIFVLGIICPFTNQLHPKYDLFYASLYALRFVEICRDIFIVFVPFDDSLSHSRLWLRSDHCVSQSGRKSGVLMRFGLAGSPQTSRKRIQNCHSGSYFTPPLTFTLST
ncbi:unnamed protein product [Orchesella dallaii]|uniref:Secreted protein n=1 Tax=Orchesella dallaii TaxID=48710 RepID=A0ABP1QDF4_9HEXA